MKDNNLDWDIMREECTVEGSDWPIMYVDPPAKKKRKTK